MISTLTLSENLQSEWKESIEYRIHDKCKYYASDVMYILNLDKQSFDEALEKTDQLLRLFNLPIKFNYRIIYLATNNGLMKDIKLSPLALYFLTIYASPKNSTIAQMQLYIAQKHTLY